MRGLPLRLNREVGRGAPRFLFFAATAGPRSVPEERRSLLHARMRVLLVSFYFPPAGGGGVQRPLKFAAHLPGLGIETHVLAPDDPRWVHSGEELAPPTKAWVHRARFLGPRSRRPAEELRGLEGIERLVKRAALTPQRFLV